ATAPGAIAIGGTTLSIAPGTVLSGQALANLGVNACLSADLNASGQITGSGSASSNPCPGTTTEICGVVTSFTPATATTTGSITISGTTLTIGIGVTLTGQSLITVGSNICLTPVFSGPGGPGAGGELGVGSVVSTGGA